MAEAFRQGLRAAGHNLPVMGVLISAMSAVVAIYYTWPLGASALKWYAALQQSGGILTNALAAGMAVGVLSELCLVYVRDRGRWTWAHLENMGFKFLVFSFSGAIVTVFYNYQAVWFGTANTWEVILPKVLVDQFIFSVLWSTPYQTIIFRWHAHRYAWEKVQAELGIEFVVRRMLPVLVTTWMFWIPGVILVYSMPLELQMPLNIFASAIWSILLTTIARQEHSVLDNPADISDDEPILINPAD